MTAEKHRAEPLEQQRGSIRGFDALSTQKHVIHVIVSNENLAVTVSLILTGNLPIY